MIGEPSGTHVPDPAQETDPARLPEALCGAVVAADGASASSLVRQGLDAGIPPLVLVNEGLSRGIRVVGDRFQAMELFLPELMASAGVFLEAMKLLEPAILESGGGLQRRGVAVIGTVKGDVHSIGKDLFGMMLKVAGFEVHNLGVSVAPGAFASVASEVDAEIVGLSALMTTTMPAMREVIREFEGRGIRDRHAILIGGSPVSEEFARKIGADGYGATAQDGVETATRLLEGRREGSDAHSR